MKFVDKYMDVLQNIETAIVKVYRKDPSLNDYDVMHVLEVAKNLYTAEKSGREWRMPLLTEREETLLEAVKSMCDFRMGRGGDNEEADGPEIGILGPKSIDEIIACLKRIFKSAKFWNKRRGPKGYLNYVSKFIK